MSDEVDRIDRELVARAAGGDGAAFDDLVRRHEGRVFRLVRAATATREDAEDALQEAFLAAYRARGSFRGDSSVRTWLLVIARHAAYHVRTRRAKSETAAADDTLESLAAAAGWGDMDPERRFREGERRQRVTRALATLAPGDREVLVLRDVEELAGDEVARALGVTVPAMKSRLHRARLRLAAALRDEEPDER